MPDLIEPVLAPGRMRAAPQPTLRAQGLTLRPWEAGDAHAVHEAYQDPAIRRWHVRSLVDLAEAEELIRSWAGRWQQEAGADWAIIDGGLVVGRVGLKRLYPWDGLAELAYWVSPSARGRRTATRAVSAVSRWALDVFGFHRLELIHSTANHASCRVADRAGFALEGTMRGRSQHADGWHDMHLHARLADLTNAFASQ